MSGLHDRRGPQSGDPDSSRGERDHRRPRPGAGHRVRGGEAGPRRAAPGPGRRGPGPAAVVLAVAAVLVARPHRPLAPQPSSTAAPVAAWAVAGMVITARRPGERQGRLIVAGLARRGAGSPGRHRGLGGRRRGTAGPACGPGGGRLPGPAPRPGPAAGPGDARAPRPARRRPASSGERSSSPATRIGAATGLRPLDAAPVPALVAGRARGGRGRRHRPRRLQPALPAGDRARAPAHAVVRVGGGGGRRGRAWSRSPSACSSAGPTTAAPSRSRPPLPHPASLWPWARPGA